MFSNMVLNNSSTCKNYIFGHIILNTSIRFEKSLYEHVLLFYVKIKLILFVLIIEKKK